MCLPALIKEVSLKAEIFSIGTELLMGELSDTNASWIAAQLPSLRVQLQWISILGDNLDMLTCSPRLLLGDCYVPTSSSPPATSAQLRTI
jgi:hypothetical protein